MAHRFIIDPLLKTGFVRMTGSIDATAFGAAADALVGDAAWCPDYNALWDLRYTKVVDITPRGLRALLAQKREREERASLTGKIAVLVDRAPLEAIAALAKYAGSTPARQVDVFSDEAAALAWLGLPQDLDVWVDF